MTPTISPTLDPTILVFSDNGNLAELTGNRPIFVDREKFIAAMNEGNLSSGSILLKPNTDSTVGQLEAVFIGTHSSHWVSWRRGNESLETFLNRTDKLDARFDEVTNR
jgi:hypothetical protein